LKETLTVSKNIIDGERKQIFRRHDAGHFEYLGLQPRSIWSAMKAEPGVVIVTQRAGNGAALHVQELGGQYATIGTLIPAANFKGRGSAMKRSGKAMDRKIAKSKAEGKRLRVDAKLYRETLDLIK
jgi:hypothetical protein